MDMEAVARVDSVVLTGLDFSMKPANVRFEVSKGFIKPFPEVKVMHQIKSLAIMVYNQEKLTPQFHGNVCDGKNTLAYFICAVHRQQAPQPQSHLRQMSTASSRSARSCKSIGGKKHCELPQLTTSTMLPLGYWESLYYAVLAEIRLMHSELQNEYGFGCEDSKTPLHHMGQDGTSNAPVTAVDLASMLESAWYTLVDNRLVAALDDAVHLRRLHDNIADKEGMSAIAQSDSQAPPPNSGLAVPPIPCGLIDINALTPESISSMLWEKYKPEIDRACLEGFDDESLFTAYRAEVHLKAIDEGMAVCTPLTASFSACKCHNTCLCRLKCSLNSDDCQCQHRVRIYHLVREQEKIQEEVNKKLVEDGKDSPPHVLYGAATNGIAQMQISALANPTATNVQACYAVNEALQMQERKLVSRARQRANTQNSGLAYVPGPRTPSRSAKDAFPLDFYGGYSGQRYPKMCAPSVHVQPPPPVFGQFSHNERAPARRPILPALLTSQNDSQGPFPGRAVDERRGFSNSPTPLSGTFSAMKSLTQIGLSLLPYNQGPEDEIGPGQNSTVNDLIDPFKTTNTSSDPFAVANANAGSVSLEHKNALVQDYIDLLPDSRFSFDEGNDVERPFLPSSSPPTNDSQVKPATSCDIPTLRSLEGVVESGPELPLPAFIAPRPVLKQRYVSAGGDARLEDRPEIPGPPFERNTIAGTARGTISKEELDAKLSDPDWVLKNFNVVIKSGGKKDQKVLRSSEGSHTTSTPIGRALDKRERTSSGASNYKRAKVLRLFSRKGSQGDTE